MLINCVQSCQIHWASSLIRTLWCVLTCVKTVSHRFAALRQLCSIRHLVSATVFQSLVAVLVLCRLHYGNGTLVAWSPSHSLSYQSTPVCLECSGKAHILALSLWPHYWHARKSPLVTSARKDRVQGCRADLPGAAQWCSAESSAVHLHRRHPVPTKTSSDHLLVPALRLSTVGRCTFPVAGARLWNDLPSDITSSPSLFTFKRHLKMHLFRLSYCDLTF